MRVEQRGESAGKEIVSWRRRQLASAGFGPALAIRIGRNGAFDLYELIELVERGSPPEFAGEDADKAIPGLHAHLAGCPACG